MTAQPEDELIRAAGMQGASALSSFQQVAALIGRKFAQFEVKSAVSGRFFHTEMKRQGAPQQGVLGVHGKLCENLVARLKFEVLRVPAGMRVRAETLFGHLALLDEKSRVKAPVVDADSGETSLLIELPVQAQPMTLAREAALLAELERIEKLAAAFQQELPQSGGSADLARLYSEFSGSLGPIEPSDAQLAPGPAVVWAGQTIGFLEGGICVAVPGDSAIECDLAAATLAACGRARGLTFARLVVPHINARGLVELARQAPGVMVVPPASVNLAGNPYEMSNDAASMLSMLASSGRPAVFAGSHSELQTIFSGGQGGANDPLQPVVRHAPVAQMPELVRFAVRRAGRAVGGLPAADEDRLVSDVMNALDCCEKAAQKRLLPALAMRAAKEWSRAGGGSAAGSLLAEFAGQASGARETFGGLAGGNAACAARAARREDVAARFVSCFTDPALLPCLMESILAQEAALAQLVDRLQTQALTLPAHEPLRYCAQGTPGTGKSESAMLIANRLGVPYVNIDCAGMADQYTATAQLLGSGRGIVGSYEKGRLERIARHHGGAVVEVSDLDHAPANVRKTLADLFLQLLSTGEAQSATGSTFSCANVIFAFTINLPEGADEKVRNTMGFGRSSGRDVARRVESEVRLMLSSAFLSRIGTPILFEPLDGPALAAIVEKAVHDAVVTGAERLGTPAARVVLDAGLGEEAIKWMDANVTSYGARILQERGRSLAAEALVAVQGQMGGCVVRVSMASNGKLVIVPETK